MESSPKLDRDVLREALRKDFEQVVKEVADAIDHAPAGSIIRNSEEPARQALDRFRRIAYEKAMQLKVDAAEAAFPPSGQCPGESTAE